MRVDRTYKGHLAPELELFDNGMCDGPHLEVGRQYLIYSPFPSGSTIIPARGCTRSRAIEDADEDLQYLKQYVNGKTTTLISGTVRFQPDDRAALEDSGNPMADVHITVIGGRRQYKRITDASGRYSVSGIPPGEYEIHAELPGYRSDWGLDEINLKANGCVVADVTMKVDGRITGVVRTEQGEVVAGALVELVPTYPDPKRWLNPPLLGVSDEEGRYAIDGILPGDYYLGINIKRTPTKEHPFAPTYYPNSPTAEGAVPITVVTGAATQSYDLTAPPRLRLVTIHGRIVAADGSGSVDQPQVRIRQPRLRGEVEREQIRIGADGRFEFQLCEGVRYSAFAFAGPSARAMYSAPIEFVVTHDSSEFVFVLNKSGEEFRQLSKALEEN